MEKESPILYYVDKEYLKYLHKEDYRVSVKFNNRPFAGIVTLVGDKKYMIPVNEQIITALEIDPETDTYESNEIRYLRKNWETIEEKAKNVFNQRYDTESHNFNFLKKTCCDFKRLETALDKYGMKDKEEN